MERTSCVIIEDNIMEFLDEIETQLSKGIICCKCTNPCEKNTKCAVAMKNLLTDIELFKKAYSEVNPSTKEPQAIEQVIEKTVEKQVLND